MCRLTALCVSLILSVALLMGCSPPESPTTMVLITNPPIATTPTPLPPTAAPLPLPTAIPQPTIDTALLAQGETIYKTMYCGTCHTFDALGTQGIFGPDHNQMADVATQRIQSEDYTGTATTVSEYIRESIVAPDVYLIADYATSRHKMPKYSFLPPSDVDALVYLLAQQKMP